MKFYEEGVLTRRYMLRDLVRHPGAPPRFFGILWWEDWERRTLNTENNQLTIATVDGVFPFPFPFTILPTAGRTFVFDITTGNIIARSPNIMKPSVAILYTTLALSAIYANKKRKVLKQLSEQQNFAK